MMFMIKHIAQIFDRSNSNKFWFCILTLFIGCAEPIEFDIEGTEIMVVDGKVSTEPDESRIILYGLDQEGIRIPLSGYNVTVISGDGEEYNFIESEVPGEYRPASNFNGVVGQQYRMTAVTTGGNLIESTFDVIEVPNPFLLQTVDTIRTESQQLGITATIDAKAAIAVFESPETDYYARFKFQYEYIQPFTLETVVERDGEAFTLFSCSDLVNCTTEQSLVVELVDFREWTFLNPQPFCFMSRQIASTPCELPCCEEYIEYATVFRIRQESLSASAYDFWNQVEQLRNNDGLVFDTYPFPVRGNVSCDDCDLEVIGFFSAVGVLEESQVVVL